MTAVLAVDTAVRRRCVVVVAAGDGSVRHAEVRDGERGDAVLAGMLRRACAAAPPDAVCAVSGPGSYTGVRVGMAAVLGLAQARGLPLHGAGTLEVVAHAAAAAGVSGRFLAVADAGRGAVYAAGAVAGPGITVEAPERLDAAAWQAARAAGGVLVSRGDVDGTVAGDGVAGLARAAAAALASPPLEAAGLRAAG